MRIVFRFGDKPFSLKLQPVAADEPVDDGIEPTEASEAIDTNAEDDFPLLKLKRQLQDEDS